MLVADQFINLINSVGVTCKLHFKYIAPTEFCTIF